MSNELVLVTGGSGFLGSHCIIQLLQAGYQVRTTLRSLKREVDVQAMIKTGGIDAGDKLSFTEADLASEAGWTEAVAGCKYVLHVASPFPSHTPKNEDELIIPAREGTLRVLRAARDAGVKRVVMTSSFAAIGYGHKPTNRPFTEDDWTEIDNDIGTYIKSKTLAERAAWEFVAREGGALELVVINPVGIFGPVLGPDFSGSIGIVKGLLEGAMPGLPQLSFGVVDVRDVADLHIQAMTNPAAKGQRFIAVAGDNMTMSEVAQALRSGLGDTAKRVPTRVLPNWLLRLLALIVPSARETIPNLGKVRKSSNGKAKRVFDWQPRSNEETIVATAESLLRLGLIKGSESQ